MIQHIYGKKEIENHTDRPNMFVKELGLYVSYLSNQISEAFEIRPQQIKKWETFKANILQLELQLNKLEFNTISV